MRDFAKATGQLAKTDALDAQVLALFAERVDPKPGHDQQPWTLRTDGSCAFLLSANRTMTRQPV